METVIQWASPCASATSEHRGRCCIPFCFARIHIMVMSQKPILVDSLDEDMTGSSPFCVGKVKAVVRVLVPHSPGLDHYITIRI